MLDPSRWVTDQFDNDGMATSFSIIQKCEEIHSPYQTIAIYETTHFGYLMTIDNIVMLTSKDNFLYHEMMTHPILMTHQNPQDIVIIGGGDCGTLKEVLKHPVRSVVQVEIDQAVTQLAKKYFPELCSANDDPRAELLFEDGIKWMQSASNQSKDVLIIDSTDPLGPAVGLFNVAFYRECQRVLRQDGILVQQSESPILHHKLLKEMRAAMTEAGFAYLLTITFPQPAYPGGWHSCTLAAKQPILQQFRKDEALLELLDTQYYQFSIHEAALKPIPYLKKILSS